MRRFKSTVPFFLITGILVISAITWTKSSLESKVTFDSKLVMDTMVTIKVIGEREEKARKAIDDAFDAISRMDRLLSLYVKGSDVTRINEASGEGYVEVSSDALKVIKAAISYSRLTEGAFDPSIGPLIHLWNFDTGKGHLPDPEEVIWELAKVDYRKIIVNDDKREVMLSDEGMRLDLGGAAKGYAADVALEVLQRHGIKSALIDVGMSSMRVLGLKPKGEVWRIGISHPRDPQKYLGILLLQSGEAIGTSGDYQQFFMEDGNRYFHILDPRTGWQPKGTTSVTILTDNGLDADILSTAIFVLGPDEGMKFVEEQDGVEAVMVTENGEILLSSGLKGRFKAAGE